MNIDALAGGRSLHAVRAWAAGGYSAEAAVELLVRMRKPAIYEGAPWLVELPASTGTLTAAVDVDTLLDETACWSRGERAVVVVAAALLDGPMVDLVEVVAALDRLHLDLVLAAIAHANGSHRYEQPEFDTAGRIVAFTAAAPLHPWPADRH